MNAQDWVVVIGAITTSITAIIGAVFAGFIALRQNPRQQRAQEETKAKVESLEVEHATTRVAATEATNKLDSLNQSLSAKLDVATAAALAASQAREMPMPDASHPMPVTLAETPVPVSFTDPKD